jgi:hypothetical protein
MVFVAVFLKLFRKYFADGEGKPKMDCWAQEGAPVAEKVLRLDLIVAISLHHAEVLFYRYVLIVRYCLKNPNFHLWGQIFSVTCFLVR